MQAVNIAGEEVGPVVRGFERAILTNDLTYQDRLSEIISGKGFVKEIQSVGMPGVMGPGVGRGSIPIGVVQIGEEQL